MKLGLREVLFRDWLALAAAIGIGPVFMLLANMIPGMAFAVAGASLFVTGVIIIPLMTLIGVRWRLVAWQVAIVSVTLSIMMNKLRDGSAAGEVVTVTYLSWSIGSVISSPLPVYFILRPLSMRNRCIYGAIIVGIFVAINALGAWIAKLSGM